MDQTVIQVYIKSPQEYCREALTRSFIRELGDAASFIREMVELPAALRSSKNF